MTGSGVYVGGVIVLTYILYIGYSMYYTVSILHGIVKAKKSAIFT